MLLLFYWLQKVLYLCIQAHLTIPVNFSFAKRGMRFIETMKLNSTDKINYVNIGLMIISCVGAFIIPFELFLFAYAVMGPLHYLTEISWLHDRSYFTKGKYDYIFLVVIGFLLMLSQYWEKLHNVSNSMIYLAFLSALILILVKNNWLKIFGILLVFLTSKISDNFLIFFSVFLPTLIHVFVFTGCFILFGALKSRSKSGIISFIVFLVCPLMFFLILKDTTFVNITDYGKAAYKKFDALNYYSLKVFFSEQFTSQSDLVNKIYYSSTGVMIMRFIAFAYTYHYLNWFSKTSIIKWHEVPKARLIFVIVVWIISLVLYGIDYAMGFEWLFFLSFLHVFLEFPLNHFTFIGIFNETKAIIKSGSFALPPPVMKPATASKKKK
jgi:hypothetical protein